jgi:hypothetical protein
MRPGARAPWECSFLLQAPAAPDLLRFFASAEKSGSAQRAPPRSFDAAGTSDNQSPQPLYAWSPFQPLGGQSGGGSKRLVLASRCLGSKPVASGPCEGRKHADAACMHGQLIAQCPTRNDTYSHCASRIHAVRYPLLIRCCRSCVTMCYKTKRRWHVMPPKPSSNASVFQRKPQTV